MVCGLYWSKETENYDFSLFKNYKLALTNYLKVDIVEVVALKDLLGIKNLFIIDEHFKNHKDFLTDNETINFLNSNSINVIIFNTEKIYNSHWKHNLKTQKKLKTINSIIQLLSDCKDIKKVGTPFINKQYMSKDMNIKINNNQKKESILFFGQLDGSAYKKRRKIIKEFTEQIEYPFEIVKSTRSLSYLEYLNLLSKYKFVLNPLGAGEFLNVRYYETLAVGSIPIQEVNKNLKSLYHLELKNNFSINFESIRDLKHIDFSKFEFKEFNYFMEDYFEENKLISLLKT